MPRKNFALAAVLAAGWLAAPIALQAQKALVYCPVGVDAAGCNVIMTALRADTALFPGGVDGGYDGSQGTVDLAAADLATYTVFVVPSLADGPDMQPYGLLRNTTISSRLKSAFIGRAAVWSGTPDVGSTNRSAKDGLIRNLVRWARPDSAGTHGPGLVALQDNSDNVANRYSWLGGISAMTLTTDTTFDVYSNVQVLTATGRTILTNSSGVQIGYTNMASYGLIRAADGSGSTDEATGGRTTRVVLVTAAGDPSNPNIATVTTDRDDYVPGDTVTITGAGWDPAETVRLAFHEEVTPAIHPDDTLSTVADSAGHIYNHQFPIDSADLGIRFTLTATGLASGKTAQTTFTDAPRIGAVTTGAQSGTATYGTAGAVTFAVTAQRTQNGTVNGTYSVIGLPTGATGSFSVTTFTANGSNVFPPTTLTVNTTAGLIPGSYPFTVRLADGSDVSTGGAGTLVVAQRTVTGNITASNKVYDGTTAATIATRTLTGVVGTDDVSLTGGTATFANKNVGNGKTVTGTGFTLSGAQASRYVLATSPPITTTANITSRALTVTALGVNKVYDGTTTASVTLLDNRVAGDVFTTSFTSAVFATKHVGTGKSISVTGISISGADAGNYTFNPTTTTTADITARPITVTAATDTKAYDRTTSSTGTPTVTSGTIVSGDVGSFTQTFDTKDAGTGKSLTPAGTVNDGNGGNNYTVTFASNTTGVITKLTVTPAVVADDKVYDGTTAATLSSQTVTGVIAPDVVTLGVAAATFADKNVGTNKTVTATGLTLNGTDAVNYALSATTATDQANITARPLTVTATGTNKVYDATTTASVTLSDNRVAGDVFTASYASATFANKNVGAAKTISVSGISITGTDAGNYALTATTATATADITPATVTGTVTVADKVYEGTTAATIATRSLTSVLGTDNVTLSGGTATFANKHVGTGKTVTITGLTLAGSDAGNYLLSSSTATATASITAASVSPNVTANNKVYDGTTAATVATATLTGAIGGDDVSLTVASATFDTKSVGTGKTVTATGLALAGADGGNYLLTATTATTTADITALTLVGSITASGKVYDGTAAATILTRTLTGVIAPDVVTYVGGTATFSDKNVGTGKTVTATGLTLSGADAGNYTVNTTATTTASITQRALLVTATGQNKVYDGTTTATVTLSDDRVAGDALTLSYASASFTDKHVGTGKTVTVNGISVSGADAGNYTYNTTATTTADITARPLTVTATGQNKIYDATTTATVTLSDDRVAGDVLSVSYTAANFGDKHAGLGKTVTVSGINVTGADAGNYTFNPTASATADVTPRALVVTATGQNKVYDGTTAATVTLSDDRIAGDVFTAHYASASFADKNVGTGKPVSVTGISLSGADAGDYTPNTTASTTADITARPLIVTAAGVNKVYDATTSATVTLSDDRVVGDVLTLAYASASFADKHAGIGKAVSVTGISVTGTDAGNYTWNTTASTTANITPRALIVTATGQNKVYDGTTNATVTLSDDRIAGDVFTASYAAAYFADKHVGNGKSISVTGISLSGADAGNYLPNTTASATADITARTLTVTATGVNKVYDGTTAATVTLSDDRVAGDVFTATYASASFADKHVGTAKPISVTGIAIAGADAGNYQLVSTTASASADITPRSLTVTATAQNKVYDGTTAANVTLADDRLAGDVFNVTYASATFSDKNVGSGKTVTVNGISLSGTDAGNYSPNSSATATADITARPLTVTATAQNKVYDGTTAATVSLSDNRIGGDVFTVTHSSATFANKNVGNGKTVTVSGLSLSGTDAGNYALTSTTATASADITARALLVSASGSNKVYDATTTATVTLSDDRVAGDLLSVTFAAANFADKHAGTARTVTVTGINVTGADAGNYTWNTTASTTADITPRALVVTATGQNKIYDGTTNATVTLSDDRIAGDVFTANYASATFADKNVGTGKSVSVAGISLSGPDGGDYTPNTTASTTADITARSLTVLAAGQNKVYDATTAATVTLSDNRVMGDVLSLAYGSASFATKHVGNGKNVSVSGISVTGADAGNYTWNATATTTGNITPLALLVSATGINKVYNATTAATATLSATPIAGDAVTLNYTSASFANKNVGLGKTVSVSGITTGGADGGNYTPNSTTSTTANIIQAPLTVTATGINKVYDGTAAATVTLNVPAIVGDLVTGSYASASFNDKNVGVGKPVSVSGMGIGGTDAPNYQLQNTTASTTANITKLNLLVTAAAASKVWDGNTTATVTLSSAAPLSGDVVAPLSYTSANFDNPNVGSGKTVTVLGVSFGGASAGNYAPIPAPVTTTGSIGAWTFAGFFAPVDMNAGGMIWNTVKGGSTVPLKFQIFAGSTERTDVPAVKSFNTTSISCGTPGTEDAVEFTTTGGTELRYSGGNFIQNWQTPKTPGACLRTTMTSQDGSKLEAYFKLK
jgi:hypothetical protein